MNRLFSFLTGGGRLSAWASHSSARALGASLLICALSCALMVPYILSFATRDQIERQVFNGLPFWNALERTEYTLLDRRFADRGIRKPQSLNSIAIVGIDEASLHAFNEWPWPRRKHARLIERLHKAGARVIGLDISFEDYANPKRDSKTGAVHLSQDDQFLAKAIENAGNVVLVSRIDPQIKSIGQANSDASSLVAPIDEFDVLTPDLALSYVKRDLDGGVRSSPFYVIKPPEREPLGGFAPLCAALFQGLAKGDDLERYHALLRSGMWPDARGISHPLALTQGIFPGGPDIGSRTKVWTVPIHYWGPAGTFPTYSYSDVLENWDEAHLERCFKNRIVLVGATAHVLKDTFPSPEFDSTVSQPEIPGVEIHATMAAMLLDGTYLKTQSTPSNLWTLFLLTLAASLWTRFVCRRAAVIARRSQGWWAMRQLPGRIYSPLWNVLCAVSVPVPLLAFWWGTSWVFSQWSLWVVAVYPLLSGIVASGTTLLLLFTAESSERRKILTQMSRLVAPAVMDEILAHPEEDYPRSRRVYATVLFTDLEGFTSYSESREPEEVVKALNEYFKRMQPIVHAHGGSVDKYIGDSVMAFFGAPVPCQDHAAQALRCAIAMQDECARFRAETRVPFWMRVGVHTGDLIVGSVGSDEQNNYTAIGDTVNLASRLEASNKSFGSRIICSADTYAEAPDVAQVERSQTPIRGKSGTIEILVVRGPAGEAPRDENWGRSGSGLDWEALQKSDLLVEGERRLNVDRRRQVERRRDGDRRRRAEANEEEQNSVIERRAERRGGEDTRPNDD